MSRIAWTVFVVMIMVFSTFTTVRADDPAGGYLAGTEIKCPGIDFAESTVIKCNTVALNKADKELNAVYRELMSAADGRQKTFLKNMQRAWIELKNAQCGFIEYYYRTAISEKWKTECEAVMTIRRVQELKALGTGIKW